ncbi:hypothetical protein [Phytohabitans aurantiacus]|uniref:DUF4242 domain-containing protein n=1 Tax=Phytohabitans aurantiacus TaxID=3016789 RepID=A0ABQ5QTJ2_9ACTN|nr:hypothetical protein [Phytohabitans aurantiacus]GLH97327.1 hypothetical protein Pa4123_26020 [Phytohabitans aurantiacus]
MAARRYRIRAHDPRGAEIHTNREFAAVLDLDGRGAREAGAHLDDLAVILARADGARGEEIAGYYLAVHEVETGALICHWPAMIEGEPWTSR